MDQNMTRNIDRSLIFSVLCCLSVPVAYVPLDAVAQVVRPNTQRTNANGPGFRAAAHSGGPTATQLMGSDGTVVGTVGLIDRLIGMTNPAYSTEAYFYGDFSAHGRMGFALRGPESGRFGGQIGTEFFFSVLVGRARPAVNRSADQQVYFDCSFRAGGGPDSTLQYGRVGRLALNSRRRGGGHATLGVVCVGTENVAFILPHGTAGVNLSGEGPNDAIAFYLGAGGRAGILSRRSNLAFVLDLEYRHAFLGMSGRRQGTQDELAAGATLILPLRSRSRWSFYGEGRVRRVVENSPVSYGNLDFVSNEVTAGLIYEAGEEARF